MLSTFDLAVLQVNCFIDVITISRAKATLYHTVGGSDVITMLWAEVTSFWCRGWKWRYYKAMGGSNVITIPSAAATSYHTVCGCDVITMPWAEATS